MLFGLGAVGPATRTAEPDPKPSDEPARPFLAQHCQACHAGDKPKGNFRLDSLTQDFTDKANRERWLAVLEQVKSGTMPPKEKPRPPAKDVAALTDWIQRAGGRRPRPPGMPPRAGSSLRRLNRAEYENTVRDLLGVDVDLKDLLPPDTSTNGFDNSAEALHVSSFLMEHTWKRPTRCWTRPSPTGRGRG